MAIAIIFSLQRATTQSSVDLDQPQSFLDLLKYI